MKTDVLIIGAGAAGLFCAIQAGKRGRKVCLLDSALRVGNKILISGGGRSNFTHLESGPEYFISSNPHFVRSALARFGPFDFLELVQKHGIPYFEKTPGQLFCKKSSKAIVEMLEFECNAVSAKIFLNTEVYEIQKNACFLIRTSCGTFEAQSLVIATGGLSFPKLGSSDFGYRVARQFGLNVVSPAPGLVPLLFEKNDQKIFSALSGVSLKARVHVSKNTFLDDLLLTHRGLSGPVILQASSYFKKGDPLEIDLCPDFDMFGFLVSKKRQGEKSELKNLLGSFFPKRFIQIFCERYFVSRPLQNYSDAELARFVSILNHWKIFPAGTEGYERAEVTIGGIDTNAISSKTMECKSVSGLYFIGEVLDVAGHLGGHNFQWAWSSGYAAGQVV